MVYGNNVAIVLAILVGLCFQESYAIRGINGARRRKDGSVAFLEKRNRQRRTTQWKGVADSPHILPGVPLAKTPKGTPEPRDEEPSDQEEELLQALPTEGEFTVSTSDEKKRGKPKESKGKNGDGKGRDDESGLDDTDCDDPDDPRCIECDDPSDPLCNGEVLSQLEEVQTITVADGATEDESGNTSNSSLPQLVETIQRVIPPFKIAYTLSAPLVDKYLDDGDYAELSETTELYLTMYLTDYFASEPTDFHEVNVVVQKTDDLLTVRFFISASFVVPGDVPTMQTMFDRLNDAFSGERARSYALLLNGMGSENPFTNTQSIALINDTPATAVGAGNSMSKGEELIQNKPRLVTMIVSCAVLVFVIVALVWAVQRRRRLIKEAQRTQLEYVEKQDIKATGYLESIRRQYRDEEPSNTEVFSGDESEDEVMTQATDNRQTLSELREAMSALESLVSQDVESSEARYPKPPSDVDDDESHKRNAEYMNYLDLQGSFDEEDLRS